MDTPRRIAPKVGVRGRVQVIPGVILPDGWVSGQVTDIEDDMVRFRPDEPDLTRNEDSGQTAFQYHGDNLGWYVNGHDIYANIKHIKGVGL